MHKLTLLAAVGAVALSGCDFGGSVTADATPAEITSIEVSGLRSANWDADGGAPDVFLEVRSASGRTYFRSPTMEDADISGTLSFDVSDVMVSSPTMPLFISVFDFDNDLINSATMATSTPFTVQDLSASELALEAGSASIVVRSEGTSSETGTGE